MLFQTWQIKVIRCRSRIRCSRINWVLIQIEKERVASDICKWILRSTSTSIGVSKMRVAVVQSSRRRSFWATVLIFSRGMKNQLMSHTLHWKRPKVCSVRLGGACRALVMQCEVKIAVIAKAKEASNSHSTKKAPVKIRWAVSEVANIQESKADRRALLVVLEIHAPQKPCYALSPTPLPRTGNVDQGDWSVRRRKRR